MRVFDQQALAYKVNSDSGESGELRATLDPVLYATFLMLIPGAFVVTVVSKAIYVARLLDIDSESTADQRTTMQDSFERYRLGLPTVEDSRRIRRYAEWLLSGAADHSNVGHTCTGTRPTGSRLRLPPC